jgi:hypothetical protein
MFIDAKWIADRTYGTPILFSQPAAVCADLCPTCGHPADLNGDKECFECQWTPEDSAEYEQYLDQREEMADDAYDSWRLGE